MTLRAAALHHDGSLDIDARLAQAVERQRQRGQRVRGLVMRYEGERGECASAMVLVDVANGEEYLVSQSLGSGSRACRADPQGFARASRVLREAAEQSPDLVVSNRFGGLESEGAGFAAELLELMSRDIPLLTVVATPHRDAWQRFTGGAEVLEPDALDAWLDRTLARAA
jgi:nucleoside-triphosphatase THEP1